MRFAGVGLALLLFAGSAQAEISMTFPQPRSFAEREGPCGAASDRTFPSVFPQGETIVVEWDETMDQPGHFRVSLDTDGDDDFVDPSTPDDNFPATLVDQIPDQAGGHYRQEITLPATRCESCTLQLVQVMTTEVPYDSFSYQCADLFVADDVEYGACGGGPATTMCCSAGGGAGIATLVIVGLLVLPWRRQRRLRV